MFEVPAELEADIFRLEEFRTFLLRTQESRRVDPSTRAMHAARNAPQLTHPESAFQILQPPTCPLLSRTNIMQLCHVRLACVADLDFCDTELNEDDAKFLAVILPYLRGLKSLTLFGVTVGRSGVLALATSAAKCPRLHNFDLVQGKYRFQSDHADLMKKLTGQGVDVSWWGPMKLEVKQLLGQDVKVDFGC